MSLLLALLLLVQGIPVQQGGTVTGTLRDATGRPLEGVRVAAVAKAGTPEEALGAAAMAGLAQTDAQGRFTLENIPPGRYVIAAGRLDRQTYYPGTPRQEDATVVSISPGVAIPGINFVLADTSLGRAGPGDPALTILLQSVTADIPVTVAGENGGKFPLTAKGNLVTVVVGSTSSFTTSSMPADGNVLSVRGPVTSDFRVSVANLPDTYVVKSITYGTRDITRGTFQLTPANFSISQNSGPPPQLLQGLVAGAAGNMAIPGPTPATPPSRLQIILGRSTSSPSAGAVVSGQTGSPVRRNVYISGKPGTFFSDGTFEFREVPSGRHLITATSVTSRPMAAIVVVGDQPVNNVELREIPLIPPGAPAHQNELSVGTYKPGSTIPLVRVTGTILEEMSRMALDDGQLIIRYGDLARTYAIDKEGHFDALYLLPGKYDLTIQAFGHSTRTTEIDATDKDMTLELTTRKLY